MKAGHDPASQAFLMEYMLAFGLHDLDVVAEFLQAATAALNAAADSSSLNSPSISLSDYYVVVAFLALYSFVLLPVTTNVGYYNFE